MSVSTRLKTQSAVVSALSLLALAACEDPEQRTALRPEGDPEVLAVLVFNDADFGFLEAATYCKVGDPKRPGIVGVGVLGAQVRVCDTDLSRAAGPLDDGGTPFDPTDDVYTPGIVEDAIPTSWHVRVMFDELLDPDTAETLEPVLDPDTMEETGVFEASLAETQPVTLSCNGVAVDYDGFYSPSGNTQSWPLGPSLYVAPLDTSGIATGSECEMSIKDVLTDKSGNAVPSAQRGPFQFKVAPLELTTSDPEAADPGDETTIAPEAPLLVSFNHFIDATSLTPAEVQILEVADCSATTGTTHPAVIATNTDDPTTLEIKMMTTVPAGLAWSPQKFYLVTFLDGAEVSDLAGGTADVAGFSVCFETDEAA